VVIEDDQEFLRGTIIVIFPSKVKTWQDLMLQLINLKVNGKVISGVRSLHSGKEKLEKEDLIVEAHLKSLKARCVLGMFLKKYFLFNFVNSLIIIKE
jgi:hypothetical protein